MEIFKDYNLDNKPFEHPLQNPCFRYYLVYINQSYDFKKLCNDDLYLQSAYNDYFNHLIDECYRPKFPPDIKVEDYVLSFDSAFTVYQRYFIQYMEKLEINLTPSELLTLARHLWDGEPQMVILHYEKLSVQIKNIYNERLKKLLQSDSQNILNKRKHDDDETFANSISQNNKRLRDDPLDLDLDYIDYDAFFI